MFLKRVCTLVENLKDTRKIDTVYVIVSSLCCMSAQTQLVQ